MIEAVAAAGIFQGCSADPMRFCPANGLTRGQAAVVMVRAMGAEPLNVASPTFTDTPAEAHYTPFVEQMYASCVTLGCADNPCLTHGFDARFAPSLVKRSNLTPHSSLRD
ncbi:MAG: hypothetical protein ACNA8W_15330 [Bradymonadaceae bacterium]